MAKREERQQDELKRKLVSVRRVSKVVKGGRNIRFTAVVVVGDEKGSVGVGTGKANEVPMAIEKAAANAKKNMVKIALSNTTIPHEIIGKYGRGYVFMRPRPKARALSPAKRKSGRGTCGHKDITTKSLVLPINQLRKATLEGLKSLRNPEKSRLCAVRC